MSDYSQQDEFFDGDNGRPVAQPRRLSDEQRDFVQGHLYKTLPHDVLDYFSTVPDREERIERGIREALARPVFPKSPEYPLPPTITPEFVREVYDDVLGLGPLEALLRDPTVTSISAIAWDTILVERGAERERHAETFRDQAHLVQVAKNLAAFTHHTLSKVQPRMTDFVVSAGVRTRLHIDLDSVDGPYVGFRRGRRTAWPLDEFVRRRSISEEVAELLKRLTRAEVSMLIVGSPGTGKTTLMEALIHELPRRHLVIIEDGVNELCPDHPYVTHIVIPPAADTGTGRTSGDMAEAAKSALRKNTDQAVYGEIMDGNAGHVIANASSFQVTLTTVHGKTIDIGLMRFCDLAKMPNTMPPSPYVGMPDHQIRQALLSSFNAVVLCGRLGDGRQIIQEVDWIDGLDDAGAFVLRKLAWAEQSQTETGVNARWCLDRDFRLPENYAVRLHMAEMAAAREAQSNLAHTEPYAWALAAVHSSDWEKALDYLLQAVYAAAGPLGPSTVALGHEVRHLLVRALQRSGQWEAVLPQARAVLETLGALHAARAWAKLETALDRLDHEVPLALVVNATSPLSAWRQKLSQGRALDSQVDTLLENARRVAAGGRPVEALDLLVGAPRGELEPVHLHALWQAARDVFAGVQSTLPYPQRARLNAQLGGLARQAGERPDEFAAPDHAALQVVQDGACETARALTEILSSLAPTGKPAAGLAGQES